MVNKNETQPDTDWVEVVDENVDESGREMWKPETVDEHRTGTYTLREEGIGQQGDSTLHHFDTKDGGWKVWGTKLLDSKLANVPLGMEVRIVYTGKRQSQAGNWYKVFQVFTKGEVGGASSSSSSSFDGVVKEMVGDLRLMDEPVCQASLLDLVDERYGWDKDLADQLAGYIRREGVERWI